MAVLLSDDERYPTQDTQCFLCGQEFDGEPAAFWSGAGNEICLHGGCAGTFVLRLGRDAWEIERDAADGKFTLEKRTRGWTLREHSG